MIKGSPPNTQPLPLPQNCLLPFFSRSLRYHRSRDGRVCCTETDRNRPACRTVCSYQSLLSGSSDPHWWSARNNPYPSPMQAAGRRDPWAHPYSGSPRCTGSSRPNILPAYHNDKSLRNTCWKNDSLRQNQKNTGQTVPRCR